MKKGGWCSCVVDIQGIRVFSRFFLLLPGRGNISFIFLAVSEERSWQYHCQGGDGEEWSPSQDWDWKGTGGQCTEVILKIFVSKILIIISSRIAIIKIVIRGKEAGTGRMSAGIARSEKMRMTNIIIVEGNDKNLRKKCPKTLDLYVLCRSVSMPGESLGFPIFRLDPALTSSKSK